MQPDLSRAQWRKSSYSSTGNCVEVARLGSAVAVRDSKDPQGPVLLIGRSEWRLLIERMSRS